jgi:Zn2+/Cd2+-exporting ATPase
VSEACCDTCDRPAAPDEAAVRRARRHAALMALSGVSIAAGAVAAYWGVAPWSTVFYLLAIALSVGTPLSRAVHAVRRRVLDINVLMVIAVAGAGALGEWLEAATVVWLFGVAQWLEGWSMDRARRAISSLLSTGSCQVIS